ncbi:MAG: hypothetical protein WBG92_02360 [Thiohalocapsa sp.]
MLPESDGGSYSSANVPRDTRVRYVLEEAKATGSLDKKHNTFFVDEFMVKKGGKF